MPQSKEVHREYMRAKRKGSQKEQGSQDKVHKTEGFTGVNAVIPEGVNMYRYIKDKRVEFKEVPEGYKVLSDGQLWSPEFEYTEPVKEESVDHPVLRYLVPGER